MKLHKDQHFFGSVKVGERGQIIIPKEARDIFGINPGDNLFILGDKKKGLAIVKADSFNGFLMKMFKHHFPHSGSHQEDTE
ncbi:MAG: AbrB/MazE/SpoVT family DNA-binding domain-containing protein [Bacteroidota bacterium]